RRHSAQASPDRRAGYRPAARPRRGDHSLLLERGAGAPARGHPGRALRRMTGWRRSVSIIVQRDGALQSSTYRIPVWVVRGALIVGVAITVLLVLGVAFYG